MPPILPTTSHPPWHSRQAIAPPTAACPRRQFTQAAVRSHLRIPDASTAPFHLRHQRRRFAASASEASERPSGVPVFDYLLLVRMKQLPEEEVYEALSELLSLMYMLPAIAVGFTGPVRRLHNSADSVTIGGYTHALHLRFSAIGAAQAFLTDPVKVAKYKDVLGCASDGFREVIVEAESAKDMDSIFRRSDAWEAGAEHVAIVESNAACTSSTSVPAIQNYIDLLQTVAATSEVGLCLQSLSCTVTLDRESTDAGAGVAVEEAGGMCALMSRFASVDEARAFAQLPPCEAMRNADERVPGRTVVELVFEIEPVQDSNTTSAV